MKSIRILAILLVHLLMAVQTMAQSDLAFKLEKENGHYFLNTSVNGIGAKLMLESGVPGFMMSESFYGSLLFLNKSQSIVESTLADSHVTLKEARDRNGKVVAEGLFADKLTICGRTFNDASVGVSKFPSLDECGFLGVKFFTTPAIFDFDKGKMYLSKE